MKPGVIGLPSFAQAGCLLALAGCLFALIDARATRNDLTVTNEQQIMFASDATRQSNAIPQDTKMLLGGSTRGSGFVDYSITAPPIERGAVDSEGLQLVLTGEAPQFSARRGHIGVWTGAKRLAYFSARDSPGDAGSFKAAGPAQQLIDIVPGDQPGYAFPLSNGDCSSVCRVRLTFDSTHWLLSRIAIVRVVAAANAANFGT